MRPTLASSTSILTPPATELKKMPRRYPPHGIDAPVLTLSRTFFPLGFSLEVRTNDEAVFPILEEMWGQFQPRPNPPTVSLCCDVYVIEGGSRECPPATVHRRIGRLLMAVADENNYSVVDLITLHSHVVISRSALAHPLYAGWFLLAAPLSSISTRLATPIHGACVSLAGQGVLLCGDSGAGKSTLAFACARAGWTFTSDDATYVPHHECARRVIGNCHQMRFRPSAATLFSEVEGRDLTPRAAGKPSIEIPTAELSEIETAFSADVAYIVFLERRRDVTPLFEAYSIESAREYLRSVLFGLPEYLEEQYDVLERMLTAPIYKLCYERLEDAVSLLSELVNGGKRGSLLWSQKVSR